MAEDPKKNQNESDPLSATAMFLRALDQQSTATPGGNAEPVPPRSEDTRDSTPSRAPETDRSGEFTRIFGASKSGPGSSVAPAAPAPNTQPSEPARSAQGPGEFTRIFVPASSAKPIARNLDERPDAAAAPPARPKGFSTPGVSDSASAETSFTQLFRPAARPASAPANPIEPPPRSEPLRPSETADFALRPALQTTEPAPANFDPSITSLIESLSSPTASSSPQRAPEPAPYRPDPIASYQPVPKPSQSAPFDSGGVTSFIQRLSEPLPAPEPRVQPAPPPVYEPSSEPGPFTKIISSPWIDSTPAPAPAPPVPAPSAPPPAAEIGIPRPVIPPAPSISVQVSAPQAHVAMPGAHVAMPAAHASVSPVAVPKVPTPHLPPVPAPPALVAPKGKLEALVPTLLVVNTFLLVVILVVMIFLIKAR